MALVSPVFTKINKNTQFLQTTWLVNHWMFQNQSQTNIFNQNKTRNYKIIYITQELRIQFNRKTVSVSLRKNGVSNKD